MACIVMVYISGQGQGWSLFSTTNPESQTPTSRFARHKRTHPPKTKPKKIQRVTCADGPVLKACNGFSFPKILDAQKRVVHGRQK